MPYYMVTKAEIVQAGVLWHMHSHSEDIHMDTGQGVSNNSSSCLVTAVNPLPCLNLDLLPLLVACYLYLDF